MKPVQQNLLIEETSDGDVGVALGLLRDALNDDGRMKNDSRNGLWEISDKGRAWLKKQGKPMAESSSK